MYTLKDGTPRKLKVSTTVSALELDALQKRQREGALTARELFREYRRLAIDELIAAGPEGISWSDLTKVQKVVHALGIFIDQTNNGGVWQFLFNYPEYSFAAGQAMDETGNSVLSHRYRTVFEEFAATLEDGRYEALTAVWDDESRDFEERWNTFKSGEAQVPAAAGVQKLFFEEDFQNRFYEKLIKYLDRNLGALLVVENDEESAPPPPLKKKDAPERFAQYLEETRGERPVECSVYYTGRVSVDRQATQLYLMRFRMADGFESLGVTGYFTHHFLDVTLEEIGRMYQKHHKQELINLYHGWYIVASELKRNPAAEVATPENWARIRAIILEKRKGEAGPEPRLDACFLYERSGEEWWLYRLGRKSGLALYSAGGEDYSRMSVAPHRAVAHRYPLYYMVAQRHKLLKDNPWGF